jgi:prolyl-tRNA synthetase
VPVIKGLKSEGEKFAGAVDTYAIETLMQDGKSLQTGTSHFLGQNFARAFDVKFTDKNGKQDLVWATSWGVSSRLIGALIMAHSDDNGLILPPNLAPIQVVIVPIYKGNSELDKISNTAEKIKETLTKKGISVKYDNRDTQKPGWKFAEYELKGVPVRIAIGPRDIANGTIEIARRDSLTKEVIKQENIAKHIADLLVDIQTSIFNKARSFRDKNTCKVDTYEDFKKILKEKGGFLLAHWDGTSETEQKISKETKATIRCIPLDGKKENPIKGSFSRKHIKKESRQSTIGSRQSEDQAIYTFQSRFIGNMIKYVI